MSTWQLGHVTIETTTGIMDTMWAADHVPKQKRAWELKW